MHVSVYMHVGTCMHMHVRVCVRACGRVCTWDEACLMLVQQQSLLSDTRSQSQAAAFLWLRRRPRGILLLLFIFSEGGQPRGCGSGSAAAVGADQRLLWDRVGASGQRPPDVPHSARERAFVHAYCSLLFFFK